MIEARREDDGAVRAVGNGRSIKERLPGRWSLSVEP
jgi:hypothetical protein